MGQRRAYDEPNGCILTEKEDAFLFDYGDEWQFLVTFVKIEETKSMFRSPKILDAKGTPPEQYPKYEEEII